MNYRKKPSQRCRTKYLGGAGVEVEDRLDGVDLLDPLRLSDAY